MASEAAIAYLIIADGDGKIIVHSQRDKIGDSIALGSAVFGREVAHGENPPYPYQKGISREGGTFELALPFRPIRDDLYGEMPSSHRNVIDESSIESTLSNHWALIGLNMQQFEAARAEDMDHTIMMGSMLLIIGFAALYFIVVVQNYYLVNRTLGTMRTYTQNVVESMTNGLISVDDLGVITTINLMASQIIGVDRLRAEGKPISEVFKSDECNIQRLLSAGESVIEREMTCQGSDGYVPLSVSVSPLKDETGKVIGAVIILRDLREIKELQEKVQRAERLASLGRLAAAGAMVGEIDRLNRIIEALLDFARPAEPKLLPCSIEDVLNHAVQLAQADVDMKEVRIAKHIQDGIPDVMMDRDQMIQVILNILLNAIDAVDEGGGITVSACTRFVADAKDNADNLRITISDTGAGIPQENRPRIFDPFFTTREDGTGLGLAIVHRIVENHRGEIRVDSEVGEGTTFTILLPLRKEGASKRGGE
jgi:two-component system sensor histidine kinase HydH